MFNETQKEIIVGSLLGDGSIKKDRNGYCCFSKSQSIEDNDGIDKHDYLKWHFDCLKEHSCALSKYTRKRGDSCYEYRSRHLNQLQELEKKWYLPTKPKRTKILPNDINITPLALCVWFMDDGINYPKRRQAEFCTQSFTEIENEFLVEQLKKMDILAKVQKFKGLFNLYIGPETYLTLINTIKPLCVWKCFQYKHDLSEYSEQTYARGEIHGNSKLTERDVMEIHKLSKTCKQFELAKRFNIDNSVISKILSGKRWGYLLKEGVLFHA